MQAIPSELTQRVCETLARCPALESDRALRAVFVDTHLAPWLNRVPENTANRADRVNALIAALCDQSTAQGKNTLILFLHTLAEQTDSADALHAALTDLAAELTAYPPAELATLKPSVQPPVRFPPSAIIAGVIAILLIAIIALANFPAARDQLHTVFQSRAFPRERKGETLIVIASFHRSEGIADTEPHEKIRRAIEQARDEAGFTNLRVAVEPNRLRADDCAGAQTLGDRYNASLVIWGEDTGVEVRVNFYNRKHPDFNAADVHITETMRTQIAAPREYNEFIMQDLPDQLAFLSLFAVGQSYAATEAYTASAQAIEAAVAHFGSNPSIDGTANAYYCLGWLYSVPLPDTTKALANYTRAIELDPAFATAYTNRGNIYNAMSEYSNALADFTRAIELDPVHAIAYNNRGNAYRAMSDYSNAFADYTHAIELDPAFAMAYYNRGGAYGDLDDNPNALADYTRAIELDPAFAVAYYNRGTTYAILGDYPNALTDLTRTIELAPEEFGGYGNRGNIYYILGDYPNALADFTRVIELAPENVMAYNNRGNTYAALGDYANALADYTRAIELDPVFVLAYYNRGDTYTDMGDYANALADFEYVLEITDNPDLRAMAEAALDKLNAANP